MSSYLTIYVKLKNVEKPAPIMSWSRGSDVYQAMKNHVVYIGNGDEWQFSELNKEKFDLAIEDLVDQNKSAKKYLEEYEKHAGENEEYIHTIVDYKEEIESRENAIKELEFFRNLIQEIEYNNYDDDYAVTSVEKYLANTD